MTVRANKTKHSTINGVEANSRTLEFLSMSSPLILENFGNSSLLLVLCRKALNLGHLDIDLFYVTEDRASYCWLF